MNLKDIYQSFKESTGICTDTRKISEGCMYVALKGGNFDGNEFVAEALEKGAHCAITNDPKIASENKDKKVFLVEDTLSALQKLAVFHRDQIRAKVIGITGSNGKTTTKELCHAVIQGKYSCYATKGNLNNHIGVPLSVLEINDEHDFAIIEMGANHPGEIGELSAISKPEIGIITNIGKAHLEGFGSFEGVIKTKNELYNYIKAHQGRIVYNMDSPILSELTCHFFGNYGFSQSDTGANLKYKTLEGVSMAGIVMEDFEIQSNLFGAYNVENIAYACALGKLLGIETEVMKEAIESYLPKNNRSQLKKTNSGNQLILDAYNANPSSMSNAVRHFLEVESDLPKTLILGDMLELGDYSEKEHQSIIDMVHDKVDLLERCYLVGKEFEAVKIDHDKFQFYDEVGTLKTFFKENRLSESFVLFKGSRGIGLENLIELF